MLKRTNIDYINKTLSDNPSWKILDIGCGYSANKYATTIADVKDLSKFYDGETEVIYNPVKDVKLNKEI